jgi:hypothetical protein
MSHFAKINPLNYKVENVIVADQEFIDSLPDNGLWIKTSYNTRGGIHYDEFNQPSDTQEKALRKNYATVGGFYDVDADAFYNAQPYPSWVLDESTYLWVAPVELPSDGKNYRWDEETTSWVKVTPET